MNKDQIQGEGKIIAGRIQRLWAQAIGDPKGEARGNVMEIAGHLQKEFGLRKELAEEAVRQWLDEFAPHAWLNARWENFRDEMEDRWADCNAGAGEKKIGLEEKRDRLIRDAEELIDRLKRRHLLSEDAATRMINDWLKKARILLDERHVEGRVRVSESPGQAFH